MNLSIPDVRTLEIHPPNFGHLSPGFRRSYRVATRNDLGAPQLLQAIRDAAGLGYNFLSIAGEQSLFYPDLGKLCREAHQARMLTTLTTRSGLLSARRVKALVPSVDLLGIRFEAGMARNLDPVRHSGIPYALVFHLTAANIGELEPTAAFAATHGAAMLHVHPAEELSDHAMATVWMLIECLRDIHRGELAVQLDVLNRYNLTIQDADLDSWRDGLAQYERFLGERISPLVVERDGSVVPLRHGFPRSLAFGNLRQAGLAEMASTWIRDQANNFCRIFRIVMRDERLFADLHRLLAEEAGRLQQARTSTAG